jgi:hypothetical protein
VIADHCGRLVRPSADDLRARLFPNRWAFPARKATDRISECFFLRSFPSSCYNCFERAPTRALGRGPCVRPNHAVISPSSWSSRVGAASNVVLLLLTVVKKENRQAREKGGGYHFNASVFKSRARSGRPNESFLIHECRHDGPVGHFE